MRNIKYHKVIVGFVIIISLSLLPFPSVAAQSTGNLTVHIIAGGGEPVAGYRVDISRESGGWVTGGNTNAEGIVKFTLGAGNYHIGVQLTGAPLYAATVSAGGETTARIQLGTLIVHATAAGTPLENTKIDIGKRPSGWVKAIYTDSSGNAKTYLGEGAFSLNLYADMGIGRDFQISPGGITSVEIRAGVLKVHGTTAGGAPIAFSKVDINIMNGPWLSAKFTDSSGWVSFNLDKGEYSANLYVNPPNGRGIRKDNIFLPEGGETIVEIRAGKLSVTVLGEGGNPLVGARVDVGLMSGGWVAAGNTNAAGYVGFDLPQGNYSVNAYPPWVRMDNIEVFEGAETSIIIGPPDLSVSRIDFSNANPTEGQLIDLSATVENTGYSTVSNVEVSFYDGHPTNGTIIGTRTVSSLLVGSSSVVSIPWSASLGTHRIYAVVDPSNSISEVDEENNVLSAEIGVLTSNVPPIVVASASPNPASVEESVFFSSTGSYDPDGNIVSYLWSFGDGATSSEANPMHTFKVPGSYTVTLTAQDNKGASNSTSILEEIKCTPPALLGAPEITNNYAESILRLLQALIVGLPNPYYIDNTVTVYAEKDSCISNVASTYTGEVDPETNRYTWQMPRVNVGEYSHRIAFKTRNELSLEFLFQLLTKGRAGVPWFVETMPDWYLENVTITDINSFPKDFYQHDRLYTASDAFWQYFNIPPPYPLPPMIIGVIGASPIDILIIDSEGKKIGSEYKNGIFVGEVNDFGENGIYTGKGSHPQVVLISPEVEGFYEVKVFGTGTGTYNLTTFSLNSEDYSIIDDNRIPITQGELKSHALVVDVTPPNLIILTPENNSFINNDVLVSWDASDNVGINYFEVLVDDVLYWTGTEMSVTLQALPEGSHQVEVKVYDFANNSALSSVSFIVDTIPPSIDVQYPEEISDYGQFKIHADIIDANLEEVVFLQNATQLVYTISGNTYTSKCLGPFPKGTVLDYKIRAWDRAENNAFEKFSIFVIEGEIKIEAEGKLEEENRSTKIELEVKWKNGEAKGELEFQEKYKQRTKGEEDKDNDEERLSIHGKITELYEDCESNFKFSGLYEVEVKGEHHGKQKEESPFSGVITENEVRLFLDDKEYVIPAKVKINEKKHKSKEKNEEEIRDNEG